MLDWEQLTLNLLSVLGGGIVSAIVVANLATRRDRKDYTRKKLEEIHELIRNDNVLFFDWWIRYLAAFEGTISLKDAQNKPVTLTEGMERKTKAEMLVNLYAPKTLPTLEAYWNEKKSFVFVINDMSKELAVAGLDHIPLDRFHAASRRVDQARENLLASIVLQSSKI